jgi:hypothetical protein
MKFFSAAVGLSLGWVLMAPTQAGAETIQIKIVNKGSHTITAAFFSPARRPDWGASLLQRPIAAKSQASVTLEGSCGKYDIRLVTEIERSQLGDEGVSFCGADNILTIGSDDSLKKTKARTN